MNCFGFFPFAYLIHNNRITISYLQASRKPREERDVSQCESVASTVSAQEDEDVEASNEEENPEDSEGISEY